VVLPRWDTDLGFNARHLAVGSGAPVAGHDPAAVPGLTPRERRERRALSLAVDSPDGSRHEVEHLSALMAALGLTAAVPSGFGADFFGVRREVSDTAPIVIHPTSVEPKRQWPIRSWRELIGELVEIAHVTVIGSAADKDVLDEIVKGFGDAVDAAPGTIPLGDLPGFFARARAFVGNDSGPAHIAASVGAPVVVVSPHPRDGDPAHRNSPDRFRPWGDHVTVVRPQHAIAPCTTACVATASHCIASISAADVRAALDELLVY
jgi:heptosyltransferase-2